VAIANRGSAYYEAGQYREALADSFKAIRLNSRGSCPHAVIGACYLKNQQYGYALQYLNLALTRQPKNFEALHFRGELYQKLGKPTLAAADFAAANAAGYAPGKFFDEPAN
jgi:tetratricopeptide (TPR) repeat protein